jgi:hypothetical protein
MEAATAALSFMGNSIPECVEMAGGRLEERAGLVCRMLK